MTIAHMECSCLLSDYTFQTGQAVSRTGKPKLRRAARNLPDTSQKPALQWP